MVRGKTNFHSLFLVKIGLKEIVSKASAKNASSIAGHFSR